MIVRTVCVYGYDEENRKKSSFFLYQVQPRCCIKFVNIKNAKIPTIPNVSGLSRNQAPRPGSLNIISLSRIKAFSSSLEKNPHILFFHSPNLFVYKLTSASTASSTIFKYLKFRRWCLLKNSSLSVLLYLDSLVTKPYVFKYRTCAKILIICKNSF